MHTLFTYNTKIRKKYPWNQDKVSRHLRSYFSSMSTRDSVLSSSIRMNHFDLQRNTLRKSKMKTLNFKLVKYKHFSEFTSYNLGNKRICQNVRSSGTAAIQKRKFCETCTENPSKLKKGNFYY